MKNKKIKYYQTILSLSKESKLPAFQRDLLLLGKIPFLTTNFFLQKKWDLISQLRSVILDFSPTVGLFLKDFKSLLRLFILFFMFLMMFDLIIAERSKSSNRGRVDPGSNHGESRFFSAFFQDGELSYICMENISTKKTTINLSRR